MTAPRGLLRVGRDVLIIVLQSRWEKWALGFIILSIHCRFFIVVTPIDSGAGRLRHFGIFTSTPEVSTTSSSARIKLQEQFVYSASEIASPLASYHTNTIT